MSAPEKKILEAAAEMRAAHERLAEARRLSVAARKEILAAEKKYSEQRVRFFDALEKFAEEVAPL